VQFRRHAFSPEKEMHQQYQEEISRTNPGAFLFLIDQSGSMSAPFGHADESGRTQTKAEVVADALNATLENLIDRCDKEEGIRDYFEVGIIGYGKSSTASFCWEGQLSGRQMVPLSEVKRGANTQSVERETYAHGQTEREIVQRSLWVIPTAAGGTPMKSALGLARNVLQQWVQIHPSSYPPIVINITDGAASDIISDQDLINSATDISTLANQNGSKVLLINCHISERGDSVVAFPSGLEQLPQDSYAHLLFKMSSELPPQMANVAAELLRRSLSGNEAFRGMVFNAGALLLIKFLDIGTRPAMQNIDAAPAR
jgi:hypothetical protein